MEMLETHDKDTSDAKWVFADISHFVMVLYSIHKAKWIHGLPFVLLSIACLVVSKKTRFLATALFSILQNLLSLQLALVFPALAGATRVVLSGTTAVHTVSLCKMVGLGRPMTWFSHHLAAFAFYWPLSVAGFLIPLGQDGPPEHVASRFAGISLMTGTLAWTLTFANIGSSIIPFAVSLSTSIACLAIVCRRKLDMAIILTLLSGSISFSASLFLVLIRHIMEKISIAGGRRSALSFLIPDSIIGGLNGFLVFSVLLPLSPLLTIRWHSHSKSRLLKGLLVGGLATGIATSFLFPYSLQHPKRVFLNHLCRQQPDGSCISVWSVAASDVTSFDEALPDTLKAQTPIATEALDWTSITPFNRLVNDMAFKGPPFPKGGPWGTYHPRLEISQQWHNVEAGSRTLEFALKWEKPGWGAMNITGPIRNWSLADPSGIQVSSLSYHPQDKQHSFILCRRIKTLSVSPKTAKIPSGLSG